MGTFHEISRTLARVSKSMYAAVKKHPIISDLCYVGEGKWWINDVPQSDEKTDFTCAAVLSILKAYNLDRLLDVDLYDLVPWENFSKIGHELSKAKNLSYLGFQFKNVFVD